MNSNLEERLLTKNTKGEDEIEDQPGLGIVLVNTYVIFLSVSNLCYKEAMLQGMTVLEVGFCKSLVMFVLYCFSLGIFQKNPVKDPQPRHYKNIFYRAVFGQATFFIFTAALRILPVTTANVIFKTNPIMVSFIAYFVLKEALHWTEIGGLLLCFFGVVIVRSSEPSTQATTEVDNAALRNIGIGLALLSALIFAFLSVVTR